MVRVAVLGITGYAALELLKLLLQHPEAEICVLTDKEPDLPVESLHPVLAGCLEMSCERLEPAEIAERADFAFSTLPADVSSHFVPELLKAGCRVVDLRPDYRLADPKLFEHWYGKHEQSAPARVATAAYGLPEFWSERIRDSELVTNPSSFTLATVLGLVPLLKEGLVALEGIVVDAKCGVSCAGRAPRMTTLFAECNETVSPFSVARLPQISEIEQVLKEAAGQAAQVVLTPHQVPMDRGVLCTIYAPLVREVEEEELLATLQRFYSDKPFVRVVEHLPSTKDTTGTNFCDVTVRKFRRQAIIMTCLDDLVKGAAGAAVQNFNLMAGFDETLGLLPRRQKAALRTQPTTQNSNDAPAAANQNQNEKQQEDKADDE